MATALGNILTSFTNGLLGTNYPAGTNRTLEAIGSRTSQALNAIPGVSAMANSARTAGALKGAIAGNAVASGQVSGADALRNGVFDALRFASGGVDDIAGDLIAGTPAGGTPAGGSPAGGTPVVPSDGGSAMPLYDYADLARLYGMDRATAYQEALSNTSYQRAVNDLRAAGLNPALLSSGMQGAAGVGYIPASVGSDGVHTGVSSAKSGHSWYKTLGNLFTIVGAIGGSSSGSRGTYYGARVGGSVGQAIGNLIDGVNNG